MKPHVVVMKIETIYHWQVGGKGERVNLIFLSSHSPSHWFHRPSLSHSPPPTPPTEIPKLSLSLSSLTNNLFHSLPLQPDSLLSISYPIMASAPSALAKPPCTSLPRRSINYNTSHSALSFRLPHKPKLRIFTRVCANSSLPSINKYNFYLISPNSGHFMCCDSDLRFSCSVIIWVVFEFVGGDECALAANWFRDLEENLEDCVWRVLLNGIL